MFAHHNFFTVLTTLAVSAILIAGILWVNANAKAIVTEGNPHPQPTKKNMLKRIVIAVVSVGILVGMLYQVPIGLHALKDSPEVKTKTMSQELLLIEQADLVRLGVLADTRIEDKTYILENTLDQSLSFLTLDPDTNESVVHKVSSKTLDIWKSSLDTLSLIKDKNSDQSTPVRLITSSCLKVGAYGTILQGSTAPCGERQDLDASYWNVTYINTLPTK